MTRIIPWLFLLGAAAQVPDPAFFESKIRPVLAASCYGCHSSKMKSPMGGLVLDTKAGLSKGGATGPVITAGKPASSRLYTALLYTDPHLQMPPTGKLPPPVIESFAAWISAGAIDPRVDAPAATATAPLRGMSVPDGRKWWAFQPVNELPAPAVKNSPWLQRKIDAFLLARLEAKGLSPSPALTNGPSPGGFI